MKSSGASGNANAGSDSAHIIGKHADSPLAPECIEKLRGLLPRIPWYADDIYVVGVDAGGRPGGEVIAKCEPTAYGRELAQKIVTLVNALPELLADYERLLREQSQLIDLQLFYDQLIDGQIIKESDGEPWALTKSEAEQIVMAIGERLRVPYWPKRSSPAEQPPAVSEEDRKPLRDQLADVIWENDESTIKNRYTFERALRIADKLVPLVVAIHKQEPWERR